MAGKEPALTLHASAIFIEQTPSLVTGLWFFSSYISLCYAVLTWKILLSRRECLSLVLFGS